MITTGAESVNNEINRRRPCIRTRMAYLASKSIVLVTAPTLKTGFMDSEHTKYLAWFSLASTSSISHSLQPVATTDPIAFWKKAQHIRFLRRLTEI